MSSEGIQDGGDSESHLNADDLPRHLEREHEKLRQKPDRETDDEFDRDERNEFDERVGLMRGRRGDARQERGERNAVDGLKNGA